MDLAKHGFGHTWRIWPKLEDLATLGGFGHTWIWPKLVWPKLVWPKLAIAAQGHTEECRIRVENELRKTEEGKARLHAPAVRVGDAPTGRALKRVRFDAGGYVSVGTIKSPCRSCDVQFFASTFIRVSVSVCR